MRGTALVSFVLVATLTAPASAGTPSQSCAAAKLKAAGKKASGMLNCERKAAKAGLSSDPACTAATDDKLQGGFAKAELGGSCAVMNDESSVEARIDQWSASVAALLRPSAAANQCAALKLRAAGKKILAKLRCHSAALKKGQPVDAACLSKAEAKFQDKFAAAEGSPPCLTTGDANRVEESVDRVIDALRAAARTGCLVSAMSAGDFKGTFSFGGLVRTYYLHVPPGYLSGQATPLVFSLHGGTGTAGQQAAMTQLHAKSDSAGFLLIEPEGYGGAFNLQTWNSGNCCGPAMNAGVDDVGFVNAMIDTTSADVCVDAKRVYSTGHSNGGMQSHRLACDLSDRIAAIAPNSGGIGDVNQNVMPSVQAYTCAPTRPVPVFHMHGDADTCYRFNGGVGTGFSTTNFISIPTTIAGWVARNGCSNTTSVTYQNSGATCLTYQGCAQGADVTLCTLRGHGHAWPGGTTYGLAAMCGGVQSTDLIANDALWDFFVAHPLP
jgi:polyhydroxybutyrate depolymerase